MAEAALPLSPVPAPPQRLSPDRLEKGGVHTSPGGDPGIIDPFGTGSKVDSGPGGKQGQMTDNIPLKLRRGIGKPGKIPPYRGIYIKETDDAAPGRSVENLEQTGKLPDMPARIEIS
jgi:hypothetical protein